ncbi:unnamed protein product [Cuscuta campestris]|uniref:Uncharacterized protein n=1 Tax=Cuscuta campestris TaxID=132261 RepID=A0A484KN84_9ASTE|nr:unnamed protein product [Cuscuta campestris]
MIPSWPLKLTILKLDGSFLEIEVPGNGMVAALKKAVEAAFSHLPCKVSWYVYKGLNKHCVSRSFTMNLIGYWHCVTSSIRDDCLSLLVKLLEFVKLRLNIANIN